MIGDEAKSRSDPAVAVVPLRHRLSPDLTRLLKFGLVGALGFVADTGTLLALVQVLGLSAAIAKVASFGVAVFVTFECNRRWAFGSTPRGRWIPTFARYLGVQTTGFLVNWTVFTLSLLLLPPSFARLVTAAAFASVVALLVNFLGARRLVFRERPGRP